MFERYKPTYVGVMITTFQRPESLTKTLQSVIRQKVDRCSFEIHVIDNANDPRVEQLVRTMAQTTSCILHYHAETERGIASARNHALCLLDDGMDFIAFIDDDEEASPVWLASLVETAHRFGADIVQGPVEPIFEGDVPNWFFKARVTALGPFHNGEELCFGYSGNVLLSATMLRRTGQVFDRRFDRSGGEDQHFFMALMASGYRIITARDAIVFETIPASRLSRLGWLHRRFRIGATLTIAWQILRPDRLTLAKRVVIGVGHIGCGLAECLTPWRWGNGDVMKSVGRVAYGVGQMLGALGINHASYDTVHVPHVRQAGAERHG